MAPLLGDAKYFDESVNPAKLKQLLDGRSHTGSVGRMERLQGMKFLLGAISKGHNVSSFSLTSSKMLLSKT